MAIHGAFALGWCSAFADARLAASRRSQNRTRRPSPVRPLRPAGSEQTWSAMRYTPVVD